MPEPKPQKPVKPPVAPKAPAKSALEKKIEASATKRDAVTRRLTARLISSTKSVDKLVADACKFKGLTPPKKGEALAPFVLKLQKQVCGFQTADNARGCDGMLGPFTFKKLLEEIPQLKVFSKEERTAGTKRKIQQLAQKAGLPTPPKKEDAPQVAVKPKEGVPETPGAPETKEGGITPDKTVLIGDSTMEAGFASQFYKGTGKFNKLRGKTFRSGRSIFDMAQRPVPNADAYVVSAAANDIYWKKVNDIERAFKTIIQKAKAKNPNARIVLMTLHGDTYTKWGRRRTTVNGKITELNERLKAIADADPKITLIDIRTQINESEAQGQGLLDRDKLHYSAKGSKAVAALLQDELQTGSHRRLTDYA